MRDEQWARIAELWPGRVGHVGGPARANRLFVAAVRYRYRAGIPWRDLPARVGDGTRVHRRFSRWATSGGWARVFAALRADADDADARIDATIVRAHQPSAGAPQKGGGDEAIGRSKGGVSTKIHATVAALGNPTGFALPPGQASDLDGADELVPPLTAPTGSADKSDDAEERVLARLRAAGTTAVLPPRRNRQDQREDDRDLYQARHLIAHFFCTLKQFRAIATR